MGKNRYFGNKNHKDYKKHKMENGSEEIFDDIEAAEDQQLKDLTDEEVDSIENEQAEETVDSDKEETIESSESEIEKLKAQLEKEKKEYLFLMADFDNYRKRMVREKADLIKNASEKVLKDILPIVDDFERALQASQSEEQSPLRQGLELIYNKLVKYLNQNGVKEIETKDVAFDTELHEAIASVPTDDDSKKGKIIDTTQKGYTLNDKVLRHAKVVVGA